MYSVSIIAGAISLADLEGELGIPTYHRRGTPPDQRHPAAAGKKDLSVSVSDAPSHPPGFSPKTEREHAPQRTTNPQVSNLVCMQFPFLFIVQMYLFPRETNRKRAPHLAIKHDHVRCESLHSVRLNQLNHCSSISSNSNSRTTSRERPHNIYNLNNNSNGWCVRACVTM